METNDQNESKCKQRFKGVENFLRRIAFNLGNSPSQTEVKIISCIPIDVTDLQQKILQLERQLDEATKKDTNESSLPDYASRKSTAGSRRDNPTKEPKLGKEPYIKIEKDSKERPASKNSSVGSAKKTSLVHTAFCDSSFNYLSSNKSNICDRSYKTTPFEDVTTKQGKSTVSFIFPASSNDIDNFVISSEDVYNNDKGKDKPDFRRNLFNMKKKSVKKKKGNKTQFVYYAKTEDSPFKNFDILNVPLNKNTVNPHYLDDMARKQYKLGMIIENLSHTSQFSSPVCRDEDQPQEVANPEESDVCSCCYKQEQNIPYGTNVPLNHSTTYPIALTNDRSMYYDSSLYDVVPVKEKTIKIKKEGDFLKSKDQRREIDIKCWPESVRAKPRVQPYVGNLNLVPPGKVITKASTKLNNRRYATKNIVPKRDKKLKYYERNGDDTSDSCCIHLGEVQIKRTNKKGTVKLLSASVGPAFKNAECLTTFVTNTDCQTAAGSVIDTIQYDKTEETLNNIKSILQSVLAEVKTNSQVKQTEGQIKKDAVVQIEGSQSNLQGCSRLLNCLTYSPFNMNPYHSTCSRQIPTGHPYCSLQQNPLKCMHNYPVIIQTAGRRRCSSCFRSPQYTKSQMNNVTAATNTEVVEVKEERTRETEKLIKEIYRSMALTMDFPTKDTSYSNYDDAKSSRTTPFSTDKSFSKNNNDKELKIIISEIFRKPCPDTSTATQDTNTTFSSKIVSNSVSVQSQGVGTDYDHRAMINDMRKQGIVEEDEEYIAELDSDEVEDDDGLAETDIDENVSNSDVQSVGTGSNDTESSASESEPENSVVVEKSIKQKKKSGLLTKMFKNVFRSKPKKKTPKTTLTKTESSDSEDYQTIYSQKVGKNTRSKPNRMQSTSRSKAYPRKQQNREISEGYRRAPYMEQEYRRHWNEKLMFKDQEQRYSSLQPYSSECRRRRPVYNPNYEARSVFIEPRFNIPKVYRQSPVAENIGHNVSLSHDARRERPGYQQGGTSNIAGIETVQTKEPPGKIGKRLAWLKKQKMGVNCGQEWKNLILQG